MLSFEEMIAKEASRNPRRNPLRPVAKIEITRTTTAEVELPGVMTDTKRLLFKLRITTEPGSSYTNVSCPQIVDPSSILRTLADYAPTYGWSSNPRTLARQIYTVKVNGVEYPPMALMDMPLLPNRDIYVDAERRS